MIHTIQSLSHIQPLGLEESLERESHLRLLRKCRKVLGCLEFVKVCDEAYRETLRPELDAMQTMCIRLHYQALRAVGTDTYACFDEPHGPAGNEPSES